MRSNPDWARQVQRNYQYSLDQARSAWLTEDIGNPLLAQHMHSLVMFQRLALASGFGWNRFVKMVDQVLPKRGNTLELLPFSDGNSMVPVLPKS